jgi:deazaflavin-dependent oxidoreductase (nitroreductase family)
MAIPRKAANRFWKVVNPLALPLAGYAPWWILVETTGRKTGKPRRVPLARGPIDGDAYLIDAVHGRQAAWVRNLEANPKVRIRHKGRWHAGTAALEPLDDATLARFNRYGRLGARIAGIDPLLVKITVEDR